MTSLKARCLVLACGNTLRGDDGVGLWLAEWAEGRFSAESGVRVLARQQWGPELAQDIANAASVLFIDCSVDSAPGQISTMQVSPTSTAPALATHHLGAPELLRITGDYYQRLPAEAELMTIGAGSLGLTEEFSPAVQSALPEACQMLEETIQRLLAETESQSPSADK